MYKRLKEFRESLGMTQAEFGASVGIAKSTYNNYETGIRDPKSDFWIAVAQKYGVTIDYLMGHSDELLKTSNCESDEHFDCHLTPDEVQLLNGYRGLNQQGREYILQTLDMASKVYIKADSVPNVAGKIG